jgi:hypothetical protein
MIVLLVSSLVLVLGLSLDSSSRSPPFKFGGQASQMVEKSESQKLPARREAPLDGFTVPEEGDANKEEYDAEYFGSAGVDGDAEEEEEESLKGNTLGDLACLPAELRVLIYRQYFFGDGEASHIRRSTRDIIPGRDPKDDTSTEEGNLTPRPCTVAHSLASNISGISLLLANKQM